MIEVNNKYEDLRKLCEDSEKAHDINDTFERILAFNTILTKLNDIVKDDNINDDRKLKIAKVMIVNVIQQLYKVFRFELDKSEKLNKCANQGLQAYYDYLLIRVGEPLDDIKFSDDMDVYCYFERDGE